VQPNHHRLAAEDANGQRLATPPSRWRASMRAERSLLGSASARGGRDQADGHGHPVDAAYGSYLRRELGDCAAGRSRAPVAYRLLVLRAASCSSSSILYSRRRWLCRMSEYFWMLINVTVLLPLLLIGEDGTDACVRLQCFDVCLLCDLC
jgi:hypothetical protein